MISTRLLITLAFGFVCQAALDSHDLSECPAPPEIPPPPPVTDAPRDTCVNDASIISPFPSMQKCVYNGECLSGICHDRWKMCYKWGESVYTSGNAGCTNCPSEHSTDPAQCSCTNVNFPDNWVGCNKAGTAGMNSYSDNPYTPPETCVNERTLPTVNYECVPCVWDDECASGNCLDDWKFCYQYGVNQRCYTTHEAGCSNCPSVKGSDLSSCQCDNSDFPNNWVGCTDGSSGKNNYEAFYDLGYTDPPTTTTAEIIDYVRKEDGNGALAADDQFAVNQQCRHNFFRDTAGLEPLEWNAALAKFATQWATHLGSEGCAMYHSQGADRKSYAEANTDFTSMGENLYYYGCSLGVANNDIPKHASRSVEAWYEEVQFYQYKDGGSYSSCTMRNPFDHHHPQIGHFTQVMWTSTTALGCDYSVCSDTGKIIVACVYSPAGNWGGEQAFDSSVADTLNTCEFNQQFEGMPQC